MERCSISPVARLTALRCLLSLLLVALVTQPSTCNRDDREGEEEQVDALSVQLSVTTQVTPTPLWAVVWGPTQPLEDETYHFLSSQENDPLHPHPRGRQLEDSTATSEEWPYPSASMQPREDAPLESRDQEGSEDGGMEVESEEVDPQFYVTVTISSLLILTAVVITAKLCYDRSCSQHPPPLSRGVAPPLSLALPRSLASEDSRQTLHSTSSSFTDRER
ncbi:PILR alpha-associated neural protein [Notolabrus celidotus]|uniref:PILR alpha-associated neural protein n=1 Tax=Notolabrus celidotus TaxID=1203425 RepID=UPI00148FAD8B|nr:PILR alpha-associated neural protein [Notolabrus celidotus]XP_034553225.1 PILR alpha-associated neural protein [Notolabrus celidotus]